MKKILLLATLISASSFAQNIDDALLYSEQNNYGSARYQAMSGAFGALGGDLSAINDNPAGTAVLKNSILTGSLSVNSKTNNASYFGTKTNTKDSNLNINQLGAALVMKDTSGSDWNKIVLAINYEQTQNFNTEYYIAGKSDSSFNSYFLNLANGLAFQDIQLVSGELLEDGYLNIGADYGFDFQQAFLGYYGGIIDPVDDSNPLNTVYVPTASYTTVNQNYYYSSTGNNSKVNFNFATQYKNDLYLGLSLNAHTIDTQKVTTINEKGYDAGSALEYASFSNYLNTQASGFSFQLGLIKKMKNGLRLGAAFQSPTWYTISEELSQSIDSNLADTDIHFIGKNQVNVFEDYKLRTPLKLTASAAMVIAKKGLISVDYHYKDYNNIKMKPTASFNQVNTEMGQVLEGSSEINIGGEYRIDKVSLRAGYRFEETPFKNKKIAGDLEGYSLGFGYNFGRTKLDLAYSQSKQLGNHLVYGNLASLDKNDSHVTASITYHF